MILLTGATGTTGSALLEHLVTAKVPVRVLVRARERAQAFRQQGVDARTGDLGLPETLAPALAGVRQVFLCCSANPRQTEWHRNLIRAAKQAGVDRMIKISASKAAPDASVSIKRWHSESDEELISSGLPYCILRPNGFMQNTLQWKQSIRKDGCFYMPLGDARVSLVDARDVAAAAASLLTGNRHWNQIHELTGSEALSYDQVARGISEAIGRPVRHVRVSFDAARANMVAYGMPEWLAAAVSDTYRFMAGGNAADVSDSLQRITGRPPIRFNQFALDYAAQFLQQTAALHA